MLSRVLGLRGTMVGSFLGTVEDYGGSCKGTTEK